VDLSAIALQGLSRAQASVEQSASRLAKAGAASVDGAIDGAPVDMMDLSTEAVGLLAAQDAFALNANVLRSAEEMDRHVLDILA
jgi:hypothetical protein